LAERERDNTLHARSGTVQLVGAEANFACEVKGVCPAVANRTLYGPAPVKALL
jgi:hypothetical protein